MGYFSQLDVFDLVLQKNAIQHIQSIDEKATEAEIRNFLGGFNFRDNKAKDSIKHFSGGEKARLALAKIAFQKPNLLLMDEPTNHLDLESITAFNNSLKNFKGTVLFSTHDHEFAQTIANRIIEIKDSRTFSYNGNYEYYLEKNKN